MMSADEVIVLGGEQSGVEERVDSAAKARPTGWALFPAAVAVLAVAAVVLLPQESAPTVVDPSGLEAPDDPAVVAVPTSAPPSEPAVPAFDAAVVDLAGTGPVTSVDRGPSGWLAISGDVVHRSDDGIRWSAGTIRGLAVADARVSVGDGGVMAVMGTVSAVGEGIVVGAVSTDSGESWKLVEHDEPIAVRDVEVVGSRVFVAGSARLWEAVDGRLDQIHLWPESEVDETSSIVQTGSSVTVYGTVDGVPAAWSIDGMRRPITVPDVPHTTFVDVVGTDTGFVALVGLEGESGGSALWETTDGVLWRERSRQPFAGRLTHLAVLTDGRIVAARADGQELWVDTPTGSGVLARPTGGGDNRVNDVDAGGGLVVLAGQSPVGPSLFVEGADQTPSETAPAPLGTASWQRDMDVAVDLFAGEDHVRPLGALALDDRVMIVTSSVVFELKSAGGVLIASPVFDGATAFGDGSAGPWMAKGAFDGTELHLGSSGGWATESVAVAGLMAVGENADGLTAVARSAARLQIIQRDASGDWSLVQPLPLDFLFAMPVDGGYLAIQSAKDGTDVHRAAHSADGLDWETLEGWTLEHHPTPVLRSLADPNVVAIASEWPDLRPLELPEPTAEVVGRHDGTVVARTRTDLFLSEDGTEWSVVPLDVEHGITGEVIVLPGDRPRVAMFDRGRMQILTWR